MMMLTRGEYRTLAKSVKLLANEHSEGIYMLPSFNDEKALYKEYYKLCVTWHYYISEMVDQDNFEMCQKIRNLILEEKDAALFNANLTDIFHKELAFNLEMVEELAREHIAKEKNKLTGIIDEEEE